MSGGSRRFAEDEGDRPSEEPCEAALGPGEQVGSSSGPLWRVALWALAFAVVLSGLGAVGWHGSATLDWLAQATGSTPRRVALAFVAGLGFVPAAFFLLYKHRDTPLAAPPLWAGVALWLAGAALALSAWPALQSAAWYLTVTAAAALPLLDPETARLFGLPGLPSVPTWRERPSGTAPLRLRLLLGCLAHTALRVPLLLLFFTGGYCMELYAKALAGAPLDWPAVPGIAFWYCLLLGFANTVQATFRQKTEQVLLFPAYLAFAAAAVLPYWDALRPAFSERLAYWLIFPVLFGLAALVTRLVSRSGRKDQENRP